MACQIARAWADGTYDARFGAQLLQKQARCQVFKVVGHPPDLPRPENPMQHTTPSCSRLRYANRRISTANIEMSGRSITLARKTYVRGKRGSIRVKTVGS